MQLDLWTSYVTILVQCNVFMNLKVLLPYHNKFPKFVHNMIDYALPKVKL